jgi:hypothetical protein
MPLAFLLPECLRADAESRRGESENSKLISKTVTFSACFSVKSTKKMHGFYSKYTKIQIPAGKQLDVLCKWCNILFVIPVAETQ